MDSLQFHTKMTNWLLERNILIQQQDARRKAYEYRNTDNLIAMIYITGNKLQLPMMAVHRA